MAARQSCCYISEPLAKPDPDCRAHPPDAGRKARHCTGCPARVAMSPPPKAGSSTGHSQRAMTAGVRTPPAPAPDSGTVRPQAMHFPNRHANRPRGSFPTRPFTSMAQGKPVARTPPVRPACSKRQSAAGSTRGVALPPDKNHLHRLADGTPPSGGTNEFWKTPRRFPAGSTTGTIPGHKPCRRHRARATEFQRLTPARPARRNPRQAASPRTACRRCHVVPAAGRRSSCQNKVPEPVG